jgi:translation initiation factor 1 (eIF-1/SUI1)
VIPQELLNVAAEGTVSRFTVHSQGDKKEAVAEIVLSGR